MNCDPGCVTCDPITKKCTGTTCKIGHFYELSTGDCPKCNDKCSECEENANKCTVCFDSTRDINRDCECNFGTYSIVSNFPSCTESCPDTNCKICENNTGTC